ncbi:MAG: alternative ribosome rescue aminoacyl-tRNA hydrolase ArfB [Pseudomonadota bacterium]
MTELLRIAPDVIVYEDDIAWQAMRAQGAGGQHVNKTSSAVEMRFDIANSHLPEAVRMRLLSRGDQRVNSHGVLIVKAQGSRSQHRNRDEALQRLRAIIEQACIVPRARKATRPSRAAKRKRLERKRKLSATKRMRARPGMHD